MPTWIAFLEFPSLRWRWYGSLAPGKKTSRSSRIEGNWRDHSSRIATQLRWPGECFFLVFFLWERHLPAKPLSVFFLPFPRPTCQNYWPGWIEFLKAKEYQRILFRCRFMAENFEICNCYALAKG